MKKYLSPLFEVIETQNENFCITDISGTEEKQGYITIDAIRDEMPD